MKPAYPEHLSDQARVASLVERRRKGRREDLLARIRANTPERRPEVRYGRDILWRQDMAHLATVLAVRARREIA